MSSVRVAVIGECMLELQKIDYELYRQSFGGDTYNTAVYLRRLLQPSDQHKVSYITAVGKLDPFSAKLLDALNHHNIDTSLVWRHQQNPGLYIIHVDEMGERTFSYWRDNTPVKSFLEQFTFEELEQILKNFDYVYLSGVTLAVLTPKSRDLLFQVLKHLRRNQRLKVIFDNNYRARLWENIYTTRTIYQLFLEITDIAFLTFDDEMLLWGDTEEAHAIERTSKFGVNEIIIKHGSKPCSIIINDSSYYNQVDAHVTDNVIDTTAAGDSFSAGYLAKRLTGHNPEISADYAHRVASTVIQHRGAIIPDEAIESLKKTVTTE